MYKMLLSLCSYYTIRILISKTLTGTYERGYTFVFEMFCYGTLSSNVSFICLDFEMLNKVFVFYQMLSHNL